MENFLLALNVVLPIFLTMALGFLLKRLKMVDESSLNTMNKLVFRVFMSTLLFLNVYNIGDLSKLSINNLKLLGYAFIIIFIIVFLAWLIYMPKVKEKKKLSVLIQGVYRGNFVLFELQFGNMLKNIKYLISVNLLRLIVNPLITIGIGKLIGFQGIELVALLSMSACPTAVASYTMAKEMKADGDLAGEIVATTSMFSILTIFCWVLILKNMAWI